MITSSVLAVHGAFEMVHLNVYVVPAVPVNVELGFDVFPNEPPVPDTIDHAPVPVTGVFAASVTVVNPQVADVFWSGPALAIVGDWLNLMITSSVVGVQTPFVIVHLNV